MKYICLKQLLTATALAVVVPSAVVAVGTEGCPPGSAGFMIGDPFNLESYTNSIYQRLGGGAKLSVSGYSNDPSNGNGDVLPGYGNKQDTYEKFSKRKIVIVEDDTKKFGIGVSKRSDAEAAAYLQEKTQGGATATTSPTAKQPITRLRRKLATTESPSVDAYGDSGIGPDDIIRFDFDGFQISSLGVRISDLPLGESGTYRAYLEGKKVMESTFQGEDAMGFVEFTIESNILFDTIEFLSNTKTNSGYLISYLEYCKTQICTGKMGDVWGDPHIESYDGLDWNCQGAGIFYLLNGEQANSQYTNFKIQAHFDKSPWSDEGQISVTRAIAIDSGEKGVPIVQLTAPWNEKTNQCKDFKFYVDGVEKDITSGAGRDDKVSVDIITGTEGKTYVLTYPDKGVQVSIDMWPTDDHGCLIDAGVCLGEHWKETGNTAKGLLGGYPNDVTSDDWVDIGGNPVTIDMSDRKGKTAYNFCVKNWCVTNEMESLFKFEGLTREGKPQSFSEFNQCGDTQAIAGIEKMTQMVDVEKNNPNNVCSKMPSAQVDDCLLESIACTDANKCVDNFVKIQKQRELKKEKEGKYVPLAIEKATKYNAAGAKTQVPTTQPPTVAPTAKTQAPTTQPPTVAPTAKTQAPTTQPPTVAPTAKTQAPTTQPPTVAPTVKTQAPTTQPPTVSPTAKTQAPTTQPPTVAPTAKTEPPTTLSPTEVPVSKIVLPKNLPPAGGANGDPHIKTWNGETYDFHGICDLILLHNPEFYDGLGMDIHIRTKKTRHWSYISNVVLRIGDDTFEVMAKRNHNYYWINALPGEELTKEMTLRTTISSFPIHYRRVNSKKLEYVIDLGHGEKITIQTWNDFVRVDIVNPTVDNFGSSAGLMGTFDKSLKVARDNKTVMTDLNEFGQEWQVLPTEPKLFHNIDGPQAPERCEIPLQVDLRRRLAESKMTREDAEFACAEVKNKDEFELCVFDVIATSDENVAGAY